MATAKKIFYFQFTEQIFHAAKKKARDKKSRIFALLF